MTSLTIGLIHTCSLISKTQDEILYFDAGSVEFTNDTILTGRTSGASGTIKSFTVTAGGWATSDAQGHVVLSNVSGTFQDNEDIRDANGGTAAANGDGRPYHLDYGEPSYTESTTSTSCRFITSSGKNTTEKNDRGEHLIDEPVLILPNTVSPKTGDSITAYSETYTVTGVETIYNFFNNSIHHYECELRRVD